MQPLTFKGVPIQYEQAMPASDGVEAKTGGLDALATGDARLVPEVIAFDEDRGDFEVVPAGTMRALVQAAEGALDPALRHRLLQLIPQKYGGNG